MTTFRIDPLVIQIRFYDHDIDPSIPLCEMNEPYLHSVVGTVVDNGVCRFSGNENAIGKNRKAIAKALKALGVKKVEWRHKDIEHSFNLGK